MFHEFIIIAAIFAVFQLIGIIGRNCNKGFPKGPTALPVFGNLLQLRGNVAGKLLQWKQQYGNMYTIYLGSTRVVVLSDLKQIRELFGMMISTSRFQSDVLSICAQGRFGIANAQKDDWLEQKNFCVQSLRMFGFDRSSQLEPIVLQELNSVCRSIEFNQTNFGKAWLKMPLMQSSSKVLFPMIKHDLDDNSFLETFHLADHWMNNLMNATTTGILFLPWLKYVAPEWSGYNAFNDAQLKIRQQVISFFEARLKTRIQGNPPKDLIDAFIDKIENCGDPHSSFYKENGWQHAYGSVIGLLLGSDGSIGIFVTWVIYYLITHPEAQAKVQEEIDEVTQGQRLPNMDDKSRMRYLEAVMLEILRMTTISSTGTLHELTEDLDFHGYHLPKGQIVTSFLHYIHNDKSIWGDPENFRPERYLEEGGRSLKDFVVAFQPGRRNCPGQQTASKTVFLYCAVLFQKYSFEMDPNVSDVHDYLEPIHSHLIWPKDLPVIVKPRQQRKCKISTIV